MQFALTYAPNAFDLRGKVMGRQSAGLGFLRGALAAKPERLWCYAANRGQAEVFGRDVLALAAGSPPEVRFIPWDAPGRLAEAGLLYRADPGIGEDAWLRQSHAHARAWSLCGVTHTISSQAAMTTMAAIPRMPLYPWDAIICTSTAARDVLRLSLEAEIEHLRRRVGATTFTLPRLPMIPLGTHVGDFAFGPETRAAARQALGLTDDTVAVLFAGRLAFHGKAHPMPMFLALQAAATRTGTPVRLVLFGKFNHEKVGEVYAAEAARFMPDVPLQVLDGGSDANRDNAWAAADIFTSLSDNIQETFGLTPLEGMAAGLPCVVSDWNGYKDTVRDGVDGFRVPTVLPPPGAGQDIADRFGQGTDDYDHFVGGMSQFAAVDVPATTDAYARLIADPALRRRMGEAGRQRARDSYDWSVVFGRYRALWAELAEERRSHPRIAGEEGRAVRPDRPDPFHLFRTYPTATLGPAHRLRRVPDVPAGAATDRRNLDSVSFAGAVLPPAELLERLMAAVPEGDWLPLADLATTLQVPVAGVARAVAWLAKMGLVETRGA